MIEKGNYNNQRIIVPKEQLEEVQSHFKAKGSNKTITDRIEAYGVKGKSYSKEELKQLQTDLQKNGTLPEVGYNQMQTSTILKSIGANAGALALQACAITTGFEVVHDLVAGKEINGDELIENALKTGADTGVKVITAGALEVSVRKGLIKLIPKGTPAGVLANAACVGIENVKILSEIGEGKLSVTQGLDTMGRTTLSMSAGLMAMGKGSAVGAKLGTLVNPGLGTAVGGFVGGIVAYAAGSKVGNVVYSAVKKVGKVAKAAAKVVMEGARTLYNAANGIKNIVKAGANKVKTSFNRVFSLA